MTRVIDLTNQKFGRITVLKRNPQNTSAGKSRWDCLCDCGKEFTAVGSNIKNGNTSSCGCLANELSTERFKKDLLKQRFGRLTVVSENPNRLNGKVCWNCLCDCGNTLTVRSGDLVSGKTQSCGCLKSAGEEKIIKILIENNITYTKEKTFEDCRSSISNRLYRFDFEIILNSQSYLIEYNGEQHYHSTNWGGFEDIQFRDKEKILYCKNNNLKLIEISYEDYERLDMNYLLGRVDNVNKAIN